MTRSSKSEWWLVAPLLVVLCLGCEQSPADHFNANQAGTVTPHGRIVEKGMARSTGAFKLLWSRGFASRGAIGRCLRVQSEPRVARHWRIPIGGRGL